MTTNPASILLDSGFYAVGLAAILLIYLPFSPMTVDLVNFSRDTQIAIYRRRHMLWIVGGFCLGAVLLRGLIGALGAHGVLDSAGSLYRIGAARDIAWFWVTFATIGVLVMLFWSGYVPYVMTPPGRRRILTAAESSEILRSDDVVLGLVFGNEVRAYPRDAIARPHYFTDTLGNTPLIISYCILCNSGIAFSAELDGRVLDLKCVTAYNNNIIYHEPATGNFIQQLDGKVIDGPDSGKTLVAYPVVLTTWSGWKQLHPETTLYYAPPTTLRDKMVGWMLQTLIPISKLSKRSNPWHRIRGKLDNRLPAMSFVIGVEINGDACGYPVQALLRQPALNDTVGGTPIVVLHDSEHDVGGVFSRQVDSSALTFEPATKQGAAVGARDLETGTLWTVAGRGYEGPLSGRLLGAVPHFNRVFWFSWALFKPTTRINAAAS